MPRSLAVMTLAGELRRTTYAARFNNPALSYEWANMLAPDGTLHRKVIAANHARAHLERQVIEAAAKRVDRAARLGFLKVVRRPKRK